MIEKLFYLFLCHRRGAFFEGKYARHRVPREHRYHASSWLSIAAAAAFVSSGILPGYHKRRLSDEVSARKAGAPAHHQVFILIIRYQKAGDIYIGAKYRLLNESTMRLHQLVIDISKPEEEGFCA